MKKVLVNFMIIPTFQPSKIIVDSLCFYIFMITCVPVIYTCSLFVFSFIYVVSISSLLYDHAVDEATVGVHPGGNAKQGTLCLLLQPYIIGFFLPFVTLLIAFALTTCPLSFSSEFPYLHVSFNFLHFF